MGIFGRIFGRKKSKADEFMERARKAEGETGISIDVVGRYPKPGFGMPSYEINVRPDGIRSIKCLRCQKESYSQGDVDNLYCANCEIFHVRRKL